MKINYSTLSSNSLHESSRAFPALLISSDINQSVDPSISNNTSPGTVSLKKFAASKYGLGINFDSIVDNSPSLRFGLSQLKIQGYNIIIGASSYLDNENKKLSIAVTDLYHLRYLGQSLSHELGHFTNTQFYVDYRSKSAYINSQLQDEGVAVLNNLQVREEIISAGLGDIGVLGSNKLDLEARQDWQLFKSGHISKPDLLKNLASAYALEEPQEQRGSTYEKFFGKLYEDEIKNHPERIGKILRGAFAQYLKN